jgi:hypothetical protein
MIVPLLSLFLISTAVTAPTDSLAKPSRDSVIYKRRDEIRIPLKRATVRPVLDGKLDDPAWKEAVPLTRFVQYDPVDGVLPPQQSIGYVTYDADFVYIAFRAFEPNRENIRATVHPRERGGELDDKVAMALDTYSDNRRLYVFRVSPIGIQFDGVKTEGSQTDDTPDFVWYSSARIDSEGWVAEVAVPFASLRLPKRDTLNFGFDFVRYHGKAGSRSSWSPRRRGNPCDICQQGTLTGITGISVRHTIDILPYLAGTSAGLRAFGSDSALVGGSFQPTYPPLGFGHPSPTGEVGADVRLALTSSISLNATINPDFSQVEADDEQIRVNQRFALFFQERRPFFLDNRDAFVTGRQTGGEGGGGPGGVGGELLYTRAIVDPSVGARLTGKSGRFTYGTLYARDDDPAFYYYKGYESSGVLSTINQRAHAFVTRVRADVLSDSWIGFEALGRTTEDSHSAVAAADVALRRGVTSMTAEGGFSSERAPHDTAVSSVLDGRSREGGYYELEVRRAGRGMNWSLSSAATTPNFRNQLGRYSRIGTQAHNGRLEIDQYPNNRILQKTAQSLSFSQTSAWGGDRLDYNVSPRLSFDFRARTSVNLGAFLNRVTLFGTPLENRGVSTDFHVDAWRKLSFGGFVFGGDREVVDSNAPRVGKGFFGNLRLSLRPVPQASVEIRGQRSIHYENWGGALIDDAKIVRVRGTYQFSRALGMRVIGEYSSQFNTLVTSPIDQRKTLYTSSVLFTYEMAPASFLYLGYSDSMQDFDEPTIPDHRVIRTGSQLFLKLSYLFRA